MTSRTQTPNAATLMAWAALGASLAASLYTGLWMCASTHRTVTTTADGGTIVTSGCVSFLDAGGTRARLALLLPMVLSAIVLISVHYGRRLPAVGGAMLMALFSLVTGFSIGLFFLPTCFLLVMAAALMPPRTTMA